LDWEGAACEGVYSVLHTVGPDVTLEVGLYSVLHTVGPDVTLEVGLYCRLFLLFPLGRIHLLNDAYVHKYCVYYTQLVGTRDLRTL
jgi:hypothetical protein